MQQLQSLYRGDSSPSLAQIFGVQYQPQAATSQMANTALASGMSAGAQIKATAMNNDTQMFIRNADRMENRRQFNLTNALSNRTAGETQRHNMALEGLTKQSYDWQTGGALAADDQKAMGAIQGQITEMEMVLNNLDKNDPQYAAKAAMIKSRIKSIQDGSRKAAGSRGGATGFAAQTGNMYNIKSGSFTIESGNLLDAAGLGGRGKPNFTPQPIVVPKTSSAPNAGNAGTFTGTPTLSATLSGSIGQTATASIPSLTAPRPTWTQGWNTSGVSGTIPQASGTPAVRAAAPDPVADVLGPAVGGTTTVAPTGTPTTPATTIDPVADVLGPRAP